MACNTSALAAVACVDACNGIMDKMGYDRGLITYTSESAIEGSSSGEKPHILRPRLIGYFIALCLITGLFIYTLTQRTLLELEVLRDSAKSVY